MIHDFMIEIEIVHVSCSIGKRNFHLKNRHNQINDVYECLFIKQQCRSGEWRVSSIHKVYIASPAVKAFA